MLNRRSFFGGMVASVAALIWKPKADAAIFHVADTSAPVECSGQFIPIAPRDPIADIREKVANGLIVAFEVAETFQHDSHTFVGFAQFNKSLHVYADDCRQMFMPEVPAGFRRERSNFSVENYRMVRFAIRDERIA